MLLESRPRTKIVCLPELSPAVLIVALAFSLEVLKLPSVALMALATAPLALLAGATALVSESPPEAEAEEPPLIDFN